MSSHMEDYPAVLVHGKGRLVDAVALVHRADRVHRAITSRGWSSNVVTEIPLSLVLGAEGLLSAAEAFVERGDTRLLPDAIAKARES